MLVSVGAASAQITADYYVDKALTSGTQVGNDWANAMPHPDDALAVAISGDVIWVAIGTYDATLGVGRAKTITVPSGVRLYGGFDPGDMLLPGAMKYRQTVLSGDINLGGIGTADAYTVVTAAAGSFETLINGFLITGGRADGPPTLFGYQGGGIRSEGTDLDLRNCVIHGNYAAEGGGLFFQGASETGNSFQCYRTTFTTNRALNQGGAVWLNDIRRVSPAEPSWMYNCRVSWNVAGQTIGGGFSTGQGGGIYLGARIPSASGNHQFLMMNGQLTDNYVRGVGAAIYLYEDGTPDTAATNDNAIIAYSTIAFNTVIATDDPGGGGAIYVSAAEGNTFGQTPASSSLNASIAWLNNGGLATRAISGPGATTVASPVYDPTRFEALLSNVAYSGGVYPSQFFTNIDLDPVFVNNASRDLRLQTGSPCINTLLTVLDLPPDYPDMNGVMGTSDPTPYEFYGPRARIDSSLMVDMGCHEHQGATP